jgi:hypothetical protein
MTKGQQIRDALKAGDERKALKIAAAFPSLGEYREVITRGWEACVRPEMYRQMGRDVDALVAAGVAAVRRRYAA